MMTTAMAAIVDASVVSALALLVCRTLRRRPAALRHGVLAAALAVAAAAPLLETTVPRWELAILSSDELATGAGPTLTSRSPDTAIPAAVETPRTARVTWTTAAAAIWSVGVVAVLAGLLGGLARLAWVSRRCTPIRSGVWRRQADALSFQLALSRPVVILESRDRALLLTWGFFRPRVVVPAGARAWTAERIHVVLAHELAHIRRRDWLLHVGAEAVRAIYWFNPLIWWSCRRLRHESEQACDDAVLRQGVDAGEYASHLLDVARQVVAHGRTWAPAPAVANSSTLERRIAAMLNASRSREPLTRGAAIFTVLATLAAAMPVAAITLTERLDPSTVVTEIASDITLHAAARVAETPVAAGEPPRPSVAQATDAPLAAAPTPPAVAVPIDAVPEQQAPASLSGTVRDASGGVLPGVELSLTDVEVGIRYSRVTDGAGSFAFRDLRPSRYELVARLPGFATILNEMTLGAGQESQSALVMRIGVIEETINVVCTIGGAAVPSGAATRVLAFSRRPVAAPLFTRPQDGTRVTPPALAAQSAPVRVGGQIMAPRKIQDASPVCPRLLLPSPSGTAVNLEATIGTDGLVKDVRPLVRPGDETQPEFVESATAAVRQWQFTPTRLNNVPVPVIMSVTVTYRRR